MDHMRMDKDMETDGYSPHFELPSKNKIKNTFEHKWAEKFNSKKQFTNITSIQKLTLNNPEQMTCSSR